MNAPSDMSVRNTFPATLSNVAKSLLDAMPRAGVVFDRDLRVLHRNVAADALLPENTSALAMLWAAHGVRRGVDWRAELLGVLETGRSVQFDGAGDAEGGPPVDVTVRSLNGDVAGPASFGLVTAEPAAAAGARIASGVGNAPPLKTDRVKARVAHELNNPLDGVLRYINLTIRTMGTAAPPDVADYLDRSRHGLMQMARIVREMLGRSQGETVDAEPISVNQVVEDAVRTFENRATEAGVVVTESYRRENMPPVRGVKLYQVCCNLIKNALDAMPAGGMLTVNTGVAGDHVVLCFEDTGVGLPEDVHRVFEPRYTTKSADDGSGLGLAMCKEFVEQLGGTLTAGHRDGGGAVFTIRIPLDRFAGAGPG